MTEKLHEAAENNNSAASSLTVMATNKSNELSSSEAIYDTLCGICFTSIHPVDNPRGRINSCEHMFCSHCIKEWAKSTNVCPSCKARFTRIYTTIPGTKTEQETKVRKRNYKDWEESDEQEDLSLIGRLLDRSHSSDDQTESNSDIVCCVICHSATNASRIIFCDRRQCTYAAHLDCLHLNERPLTFLCPSCTELRQDESSVSTVSANNSLHDYIEADQADHICSETASNTAVELIKANNIYDVNNVTSNNINRQNKQRYSDTVMECCDNNVKNLSRSAGTKLKLPRTQNETYPTVNTNQTVDFSRINLPFVSLPREQEQQQHQQHQSLGVATQFSERKSSNGTNVNANVNEYHNTIKNNSSNTHSSDAINTAVNTSDDLYFLAPNPHAAAALNGLHYLSDLRRHNAEMRETRTLTRSRQWQEAHHSSLVRVSPHDQALERYLRNRRSTLPSSQLLASTSAQATTWTKGKRSRTYNHTGSGNNGWSNTTATTTTATTTSHNARDYAELEAQLLEEEVINYTDPVRRREMEDRLAREWAHEMMPILRQRHNIAHQRLQLNDSGGIVFRAPETAAEHRSRECALWDEAMRQAREVVQAKMNATARQLRIRREQLVQARAVREAAALAKLARVIALHRQQEQAQESAHTSSTK